MHRGAFFAELRTTTVRKLLPESWGFLCPVHTPDGAPCGLLNHLSSTCHISTKIQNSKALPAILVSLGMTPMMPGSNIFPPDHLSIFLDGKLVGKASTDHTTVIADKLRFLKIHRNESVPWEMEIGLVKPSQGGQYPGLYIWTTPAKMMRPVKHLATGVVELIGCFEQIYLDIAVLPSEVVPAVSSHVETNPTNMLSVVANATPFCDFNQSPRNMYQCVSGDHDVLTSRGWRSIVDVSVGESVLVMNPSNGVQEWEAITGKLDEAYDGLWYRMSGSKIDAVCTPEHRWLVKTKDAPSKWIWRTAQQAARNELTAQCIDGASKGHWDRGAHRNHSVPLVGKNSNALYQFDTDEGAFLLAALRASEAQNLDFCRLIGLVLGDGGIEHTVNKEQRHYYYTTVHQTVAKAEAVEYIEGVLTRLSTADKATFAYSVGAGTKGKNTYRFACRALYDFFEPMMRGVVGFDPLNDAHVQAYDHATAYERVTTGDAVECEMSKPLSGAAMTSGAWSYMRRWLFYSWRFRLSRAQARALLEGFMAADGQWSDVVHARSMEGGVSSGRGHRSAPNASDESAPPAKRAAAASESGQPLAAPAGVEHVPLIYRGHVRGFNSSLPLINDLAALALLAEGRPKIGIWHKKGDVVNKMAIANATCWSLIVSLNAEELVAALPKPMVYAHDGHKYCITVPSGNFLARRRAAWTDEKAIASDGMPPFFTGNCQMGKQTMGSPAHAYPHRSDNKMYRIMTPQTPIVRPANYSRYSMDNYPNGANAVVAVISYTGYDMEDAMILNKFAFERGFGNGSIYQTKWADLTIYRKKGEPILHRFGLKDRRLAQGKLDSDGLPYVSLFGGSSSSL